MKTFERFLRYSANGKGKPGQFRKTPNPTTTRNKRTQKTFERGNRTISRLFLDDDSGFNDEMGIRTSISFSYSSGASSAWVGAGLINKPIGDFSAGTHNNDGNGNFAANFAAQSSGSVRVVVNSQVIPEPEEYALMFALFALGFVVVRRRMMQRKQRQAATS